VLPFHQTAVGGTKTSSQRGNRLTAQQPVPARERTRYRTRDDRAVRTCGLWRHLGAPTRTERDSGLIVLASLMATSRPEQLRTTYNGLVEVEFGNRYPLRVLHRLACLHDGGADSDGGLRGARAHMIETRNITTAPERSSTHEPIALSVLCFTAELAIRQQVLFRMRSGAFVRGDAQPSNTDAA
jgi:hypothetical protein